ncbi:DUF4238 domain-containing protein [Chitinophaga pinensis]|uniref:DUF4238 domain-containing protein n=1 Tax=Chitinophaga pinensis (strain ATCC 43595 / DSM 2588 / LMG 13176 / NBRC 15968 / NCIMB 11800 / UQM 2034) TaxID=485918 RepID=A0A979GVC6_CHIPD|nr:DUF4238 domain-containing protein [Chitinophaga pinensis]ACU60966.1 hypothetical protein Cpin_3502 [Chitinophaga pinensis DSM 2588]
MKHNPPKNHHYVPVCYLKQFANLGGNLLKKRLDYDKIAITTPSKICYEIDGNRFNGAQSAYFNNVTDEYHIEKEAFKLQENNYGNIIVLITDFYKAPKILNGQAYRLFIETLVTIKRRNPSFRKALIENFQQRYVTDEALIKFKQFLTEQIEGTEIQMPSDQQIRQKLMTHASDPAYMRDMYLSGHLNTSPASGVNSVSIDLYNSKQYILHAPDGLQFITSDNPGFTFFDGRVENGTGFGANCEFYFPLTPFTCLYINTEEKDTGNELEKAIYPGVIGTDQLKFINESTKKLALKILIGRDEHVLADL